MFLSGDWDSNIKYRSSFDKNLKELQPKYYQEKGKWVDFIFLGGEYNIILEVLTQKTLRLVLLLFWRDIANKLNVNSLFKLQLKLNLSYSR